MQKLHKTIRISEKDFNYIMSFGTGSFIRNLESMVEYQRSGRAERAIKEAVNDLKFLKDKAQELYESLMIGTKNAADVIESINKGYF